MEVRGLGRNRKRADLARWFGSYRVLNGWWADRSRVGEVLASRFYLEMKGDCVYYPKNFMNGINSNDA
jgi:hypothetical protein